jgi:hypothetical protein
MAVTAALGRRQVVVKDPGYQQRIDRGCCLYPGSFTTTAAQSAAPPLRLSSPFLPFSCFYDACRRGARRQKSKRTDNCITREPTATPVIWPNVALLMFSSPLVKLTLFVRLNASALSSRL